MTVGTHVVKLFRNPVPFGSVLNTNPAMTSNVIGWGPAPFEIAPVWSADGWAENPRGGSLTRVNTDANPTLRNLADTIYRVRVRITTKVSATIRWGITIGRTVNAVSGGEFFSSGAGKDYLSPGGVTYPAGTYDLSGDFLVPASQDPTMIYVGPRVITPYRADTSAGPNRVDYLELLAMSPSDVVDISCLLDQVSIRHGRSDTTSQPDPSSATLDLAWKSTEDSLPALAEVGSYVEVATVIPAGARVRFFGRITDLATGWDEAEADTPYTEQAQLTAVATMSDLGRRVVGDAPWPLENDAQRVARVAALAGMPLSLWTSDPGTVSIRARDVDSQPALSVMRETAVSGLGMVWQSKDGELRYSDSGHRARVAVGLELDACDVLVSPTWVRNLDGLTNEVAIGYGSGSGGSQPRYTATNLSSQTKWGRYAFTTDTLLAALADATAMGDLLMRRNYEPVWVLSAIPLSVEDLTDTETDRLLSLDLNDLVHIANLPAIGSAPTDLYGWVEGWTETLSFGVHDMELALSGYCRTSAMVRWDDPTTMTWNTAPAGQTWDQSYCVGYPGPGVGRWDDTPTSLRWDQVLPATTWDTWTQPTAMDEVA